MGGVSYGVPALIQVSNLSLIQLPKLSPSTIFSYDLKSQIPCRILRWLTDEEERLKEANLPRVQFLIVEMSRK